MESSLGQPGKRLLFSVLGFEGHSVDRAWNLAREQHGCGRRLARHPAPTQSVRVLEAGLLLCLMRDACPRNCYSCCLPNTLHQDASEVGLTSILSAEPSCLVAQLFLHRPSPQPTSLTLRILPLPLGLPQHAQTSGVSPSTQVAFLLPSSSFLHPPGSCPWCCI